MRRLLITALALSLSGCAVSRISKRAANFSQAATSVIQKTSDAYETVDKSYYDTQVQRLVINFDKTGFNPSADLHFLKPEDLKPRQDLLKALRLYAQSLAEVSGDKPLSALDDQAKALGSSLSSIANESAVKKLAPQISATEIQGFTTAIDAFGTFLINEKRSKDLPKIIHDMDAPLKQVTDLLILDIGNAPKPDGTGGSGLRDQLWRDYDRQIHYQEQYIRETKDLSPADRRTLIEQLPKFVKQQQDADSSLEATKDALHQLVTTHQAILQSGKDDNSFRAQLGILIDQGSRIQDFYNNMAKSK